MTKGNFDLHGCAPDSSKVALLLVDVINPLDFPEADDFAAFALPAARNLRNLCDGARALGIPVIYANDNFGRWRSDLRSVLQRCMEPGCRGRPLAELLHPDPEDYFVLKPKHSAFFSTTLDLLLRYLGVETLVLGGFATNICVLFTANDAYMRDLHIVVVSDGVASNTGEENNAALSQMETVLKCDLRQAATIDWRALKEDAGRARED